MARIPRWAMLLGPILVGIAGAALALQAFAKTTVDAGPFQIQLEADFGRSVTDISLPPLGRLRADTHGAPLHLRASLREVDVEQLQEGLRRGVDSVAAEVERNTFAAVGRFAGWVILVGIAGAATLGLLAFRDRWLEVLRATVAGLVAVVLSVGFTVIGFDAAAFQAPSYSGSLRLVPQLFGPVEGAIERVGYFRDELRRVVAGAARAYAAVESNPLGRGDEVRVLHISDIHLSTLGYGFAHELARSFDVEFVIDTGDTTSFGASNEEFILSEIPEFELPYVWVRGNHDSADFQDAVARTEGAVVLDGQTTEVDGFTIYGLGHPYFNEQRGTPVGDEDVVALVEAAAERVTADVSALPDPPDIVLVHDDRMAAGGGGLGAARPVGPFPREPRRGGRRDAVPSRGHHRRRRPDRFHGGRRRAVLGGGPLLRRRWQRRDEARRVGRGDAVPRDGEPSDRAPSRLRRRSVAEPCNAGSFDAERDDREPLGVAGVSNEETRSIPIEEPYDLARTLFPLRRGTGDPTMRIEGREAWRAARTPEGPATLLLQQGDGRVRATGWGPGTPGGRSTTLPALIGAEDDLSAFEPRDDVMAQGVEGAPGRAPHAGAGRRAHVDRRDPGAEGRRARGPPSVAADDDAVSEPAPGEGGLLLPPDPSRVAELPYFRFHPWGVERRRAQVIRAVCARAASLEALADVPPEDARRRLETIPGVGPWTSAEVARLSFGDPDAISVGDYHVPSLVTWALAGEPRGTDERMLELLEPYRGQRGRVQLLLEASHISPPAYGPRMEARSIDRL